MDNAIGKFQVFASRAKYAAQNQLCASDKKFAPLHLEQLHGEADSVMSELRSVDAMDPLQRYHDVVRFAERARLTGNPSDLTHVDTAVRYLNNIQADPKNKGLSRSVNAAKISANHFKSHAQTTVQREIGLHRLADKALSDGKLVEAKRKYDLGQIKRPVLGDATKTLIKLKSEIGPRRFIERDLLGDRATAEPDIPSDQAVTARLQAISKKLHNGKRIGELRNSVKARANGIIKYGTGDAAAMLEQRANLESKLGAGGQPIIASIDRRFVAPALKRMHDSTSAKIAITRALHGERSFSPLVDREALSHETLNANDHPEATSFHAAAQNIEQLRRAHQAIPGNIATTLPPLGALEQQFGALLRESSPRQTDSRAGNPLSPPSSHGESLQRASSIIVNPLSQMRVPEAQADPFRESPTRANLFNDKPFEESLRSRFGGQPDELSSIADGSPPRTVAHIFPERPSGSGIDARRSGPALSHTSSVEELSSADDLARRLAKGKQRAED